MRVRSLGQEGPLEGVWQSTPVFLPRECHGQRRVVGYCPQGHKSWTQMKRLSSSSSIKRVHRWKESA